MDPFETLSLARNATRDDLKKAFRKEAMQCHPDRAGNSPEATQRFQDISQAYQILSRQFKKDQRDKNHNNQDDMFWNANMDYAIGLVRSGFCRESVKTKIMENGCTADMADSITEKAFNFQGSSKNSRNKATQDTDNNSVHGRRKFDYASIQAFLGKQNPGPKTRKLISDYQEIFNEIHQQEQSGALVIINKNRYLSKIFNRAIILFIIITALLYFFPQLTKHTPLSLIDFFQLPNVVLSLMLLWCVYRKLWLLTGFSILLFIVSQMYYYYSMPFALEGGFSKILLTALASYLPFIFLSHLSNFFFYKKISAIDELVNQQFPLLEERQILFKNLGGVSRLSAFFLSVLISLYFLHMVPQQGSINNKVDWILSNDTKIESRDKQQAKNRIRESARLFNLAEAHFKRVPPKYESAKSAYVSAANYGSLLSSYKLGYMYLSGTGCPQDDRKALYYFEQAVNSPLASQPHSLSLTTKWLSESYYALGVMYLGGYGTQKNERKARQMFTLALQYGASERSNNPVMSAGVNRSNLRDLISLPDYEHPSDL